MAEALLALVVGGGLTAVALGRTRMARGHRDLAGFSLGIVLTGLVAFATVTALVAPGVWGGLYRFAVSLYQGGA